MAMQVLRFGTGVGRDGGSVQVLAREVGWRSWSDGPSSGFLAIQILTEKRYVRESHDIIRS
jgi:hypothetical protein